MPGARPKNSGSDQFVASGRGPPKHSGRRSGSWRTETATRVAAAAFFHRTRLFAPLRPCDWPAKSRCSPDFCPDWPGDCTYYWKKSRQWFTPQIAQQNKGQCMNLLISTVAVGDRCCNRAMRPRRRSQWNLRSINWFSKLKPQVNLRSPFGLIAGALFSYRCGCVVLP